MELVPADSLAQKVKLALPEVQVLLETLDRVDSKACLVIPDCRELEDNQDLLALLEGKEHQVNLDHEALMEFQAFKVNRFKLLTDIRWLEICVMDC